MRKKEKQQIPWQDKVAARIAGRIINIQMFISRKLQMFEQRLTVKQKKMSLFIFCFISSAYLFYLLGNALFFEQHHSYYDSLPGQGKRISQPDSTHLPNASTKRFIHHKNQRP